MRESLDFPLRTSYSSLREHLGPRVLSWMPLQDLPICQLLKPQPCCFLMPSAPGKQPQGSPSRELSRQVAGKMLQRTVACLGSHASFAAS